MSPLYPDGPEEQAQDPSNGSPFGQDPEFRDQNGGGRVGNIFNTVFACFAVIAVK